MPRLLSQINSAGAVGIQSDGTSLGNATKLNFESNRVKLASTGIATVTSDPISLIGL
tara:strand:+ start:546 stop:716 length:171 start_codon:yes stop_codon:yes gene_type:complete